MNILITGASRGIGAATYALLKAHGHEVAAIRRSAAMS